VPDPDAEVELVTDVNILKYKYIIENEKRKKVFRISLRFCYLQTTTSSNNKITILLLTSKLRTSTFACDSFSNQQTVISCARFIQQTSIIDQHSALHIAVQGSSEIFICTIVNLIRKNKIKSVPFFSALGLTILILSTTNIPSRGSCSLFSFLFSLACLVRTAVETMYLLSTYT